MAKTNDSDAPAADTTPSTATTATAPTPAAARASRSGLGIAGIAVGSVLAAALLFGGGVAVGLALPSDQMGPDSASGQLDERQGERDGVRPGDRDGVRPGGHDRQLPPLGGNRPMPGQSDTGSDGGSTENPDDAEG